MDTEYKSRIIAASLEILSNVPDCLWLTHVALEAARECGITGQAVDFLEQEGNRVQHAPLSSEGVAPA